MAENKHNVPSDYRIPIIWVSIGENEEGERKIFENAPHLLTMDQFRELWERERESDCIDVPFFSCPDQNGDLITYHTVKEEKSLYGVEIEGISSAHVKEMTEKDIEYIISYFYAGDNIPDLIRGINKATKKEQDGHFYMSKDLIGLAVRPKEALVSDEVSEDIKETIRQGNDLNGEFLGLSNLDSNLYKTIIALAQTLDEQSKYFDNREDLEGLSDDVVQALSLSRGGGTLENLKKEGFYTYRSPLVFVTYNEFTKKLQGGTVGGRDTQETKSYLQKLINKEYFVRHRGGYIGIPLISKAMSLYTEDGKQYGMVLSLSPHFAQGASKYAKVASDVLKKLRGKQRNITMNLILTLLDAPNNKPFRKKKTDLLKQIGGEKVRYKQRPKELENEFQEAVQRAKEVGVITGYREQGGISIFSRPGETGSLPEKGF